MTFKTFITFMILIIIVIIFYNVLQYMDDYAYLHTLRGIISFTFGTIVGWFARNIYDNTFRK